MNSILRTVLLYEPGILALSFAGRLQPRVYEDKTGSLIVDGHGYWAFIPEHINQTRESTLLKACVGTLEIGKERWRRNRGIVINKADLCDLSGFTPCTCGLKSLYDHLPLFQGH